MIIEQATSLLLKRYLTKDIYQTTSAILLVLILIFVSSRFVKYIQLAVDGTISAKAVFTLLALQIPSIAGFLIPLSLFLAILLTFGRLYAENELVVVHSLGLGEKDIARMMMPMAIVFTLVAGSLSTLLTPWAVSQSKVLMSEQAAQAKLGVFSAGRFRENPNKDGIVFVEGKTDSGTITGIFSASRPRESVDNQKQTFEIGQLKIQTARKGRQWENKKTGVNYLVLEQGQFSEYRDDDESWQITDFSSTYTQIKQSDLIDDKNSGVPISTLELFKVRGNKEWAEIHWRLAAPITIPIIFLMAIPLSRLQPRQGKFSRLFPSILIYLFYVLLMMYSRKLIESGKIPGELGFWWIHIGFLAFVYWLYLPARRKKNSAKPPTRLDSSGPSDV